MKLAVVGSGYVSIVTGACFAGLGHHVHVASPEEALTAQLQQGIPPFYEEGLEALLKTEIDRGHLRFSTDVTGAVAEADVVFLCVAAPPLPDGKPDMKPLIEITQAMAKGLGPNNTNAKNNGYKLIVERSTLPVKTSHWLRGQFEKLLPEDAAGCYDLAAVPQFLREGQAIKDFYHPDRIVIGAESQRAIDLLVELYSELSAPMLMTDINSAELIKHATNAFLAMKISFINSMAHLCEKTGADISQVAKGLGMDKRISPDFLNAGIGYGGIFFPRDIASLLNIGQELSVNLDLLKTTETINRYQRIAFMERVEAAAGGDLHGKTVALWGLAYRPNTDDMRDAPSTQIIWGLQNRGAKIRAYDPLAMEASKEKVRGLTYCKDAYDAAQGADVIAILTEWDEFSQINFKQLTQQTTCRVIVDGRNLFSPKRMAELGFHYVSIGRSTVVLAEKA